MYCHESHGSGEGPEEARDDPRDERFLLHLVLEVVTVVSRDQVPGLSSHLHRLDKVEESVMGRLESHEAKEFGVTQQD